ncbi:hypothetical protein CC1G_04739 [Coprinopsis cinerea okayama7|uniref:Uncharacterized protein n=1 Tax=Coprinopsis cinerea (strain Okayama-7 / 130 / ATCC MYA-4618 / FGSC 9003) TaxID=240176 RepID=A8P2D8_COPC7|nr:hypothetical protein CC1G_04739 [Coprinopsis cinerea okayama7\|eukprot:XP_001838295.2 hypothetical protein CC1G_04739 [Coprinopsis cinerea okayama7\
MSTIVNGQLRSTQRIGVNFRIEAQITPFSPSTKGDVQPGISTWDRSKSNRVLTGNLNNQPKWLVVYQPYFVNFDLDQNLPPQGPRWVTFNLGQVEIHKSSSLGFQKFHG